MKKIFTRRITKVLLLMLFCCSVSLTQHVSFIKYGYDYPHYPIYNPGYYPNIYGVYTNDVEFIIKEDHYNNELLDKLKSPPYSLIYSFNRVQNRNVRLSIKGNIEENINVLDHYLKFEKEEFVEAVIPRVFFSSWEPIPKGWDIEGQILYNGKSLSNNIINVAVVNNEDIYPITLLFNSITDEDGNYVVKDMGIYGALYHPEYPYICTLSFKIGNTIYDTTFTFGGKKYVDINVTSTWKEFEIKGQILQNNEPLIYRTITLTDQFDFVCSSFTDENGNYTFPYMREDYNYTLSFEVEDIKYDTTFVLDENKSIDFNLYAPTSNIKGQVLKDGKPLGNHTIYTYNEFNLYNCTTDENGNYTFPDKVEKYDYTLFFRIEDTRYDTTFVLDGNKTLDFTIGSVDLIDVNEPEEIPTTYSLSQNYPNPFNPTTTIQYAIPKDGFVKLTVYDITGRVVKELVNGHKTAGKYSVEFNASSYASGTYYYKIEAGEYKNIQKMMLIK